MKDESSTRNSAEVQKLYDAAHAAMTLIADMQQLPKTNHSRVLFQLDRAIRAMDKAREEAPVSERGPSAEAARIARKVLDEKGLYNITTEEMVLAREILRLASPAERTKP